MESHELATAVQRMESRITELEQDLTDLRQQRYEEAKLLEERMTIFTDQCHRVTAILLGAGAILGSVVDERNRPCD